MEKIKTVKELKGLLSDKINECNIYVKKFDESNMSHSAISSQAMSIAYDFVLDLIIESKDFVDANTFINSLDNDLYNKIRNSKSDAECRRYLKYFLLENKP